MLEVEVGSVVRVGAEVELCLVAAKEVPRQTSEVGNLAFLHQVARHFVVSRGSGIIEVLEVGGIARKFVGLAACEVAALVAEAHTSHQTPVAHFGLDIVVGEVFPLVVMGGVLSNAEVWLLAVGIGRTCQVAPLCGRIVFLGEVAEGVTHAAGEDEALEWGEVE